MQTRHEKEVMLENRVFREEQYATFRQKEYEEALHREHELYIGAKNEYRHQVGMQMDQHFEIMKQKQERTHEKNIAWVEEKITNELINLTFKMTDYKILHDSVDIPLKKMLQWKLLLSNGMSIIDHDEVQLAKNVILSTLTAEETPEDLPELQHSVKVLDTDEFDDYLQYKGNWKSSADGLLKNNVVLAGLVDHLISVTKQPEAKYELTPLSNVPLRIALIGKKFSGKSSIATFIAKKYNMSILRLEDLVRSAVRQFIEH